MQAPPAKALSRRQHEPIAFLWDQFGAYHMARMEALGSALAGDAPVYGLEVATSSATYAWPPSGHGKAFTKITLFPGARVEELATWRLIVAILAVVRRRGIRHLFLAGYERPAIFFSAVIARLLGIRVYVALDSKFDDKSRRLRLELLKRLLMLPYHGAIASGTRAETYLRFLGLRGRPVTRGYDSVAITDFRAYPTPPPPCWAARPFLVVSRFVPKKNLVIAIRAFAAFRAAMPHSLRRLRLCGSGPLEHDLREEVRRLGIEHMVDFLGFLDAPALAREYSAALCLLLPSVEEQWGLVVNEALAFALPVIVAEGVGACDMLVSTLVNGFILNSGNTEAWCEAMTMLAADEALWKRLSLGAAALAPSGDVGCFVEGVTTLTDGGSAVRGTQFNSAWLSESVAVDDYSHGRQQNL